MLILIIFYACAGFFLITSTILIILRFTKYWTMKPFEEQARETRISEPEIWPTTAIANRGTTWIDEWVSKGMINEDD